MTCVCRVALHLQLIAVNNPHHTRADTTALSSMARAVDSVQTRQSSAERDVYAEQQQAVAAAASGAALAAAAEDAVMTSCEVAQKLLQQLEELGTSGVMDLMKEVLKMCVRACMNACMCLCICVQTKLAHVRNVE